MADTGLATYLLGLDTEALSQRPAMWGPLVENFVFAELSKLAGMERDHSRGYLTSGCKQGGL